MDQKDLIKYGLIAIGAYLIYKYVEANGGLSAVLSHRLSCFQFIVGQSLRDNFARLVQIGGRVNPWVNGSAVQSFSPWKGSVFFPTVQRSNRATERLRELARGVEHLTYSIKGLFVVSDDHQSSVGSLAHDSTDQNQQHAYQRDGAKHESPKSEPLQLGLKLFSALKQSVKLLTHRAYSIAHSMEAPDSRARAFLSLSRTEQPLIEGEA